MVSSHRNTTLVFRGLALFLWLGVIFFFSHQPGSGSEWEPPLWYILERKSAHVFEYAVLMFLTFRFLWTAFSGVSFSRTLLFSALFSFIYALSDEFHQSFIFGRGARLTDVAVDVLGIMLSALFLLILWRSQSVILKK